MHRANAIIVTLTALIATVSAGCQGSQPSEQQLADQRLLEKRHARRMGRLERTVHAIERSEASRPERMERTLAAIDRRMGVDVERLERDVAALGNYIQRDFDRWERRQPLYREAAAKKLWGDPERIPGTAIILFW